MSSKAQKLYDKLLAHLEKARAIESAIQLAEWDQETYMPKEGITFRSITLSHLSQLYHKLQTSPSYKKLLHSLNTLSSDLSPHQLANLTILHEDFEKQAKLPASFVKSFSKLSSEATFIWQKAKEQADFKLFAPHLKQIIKANRKKAALLGFTHHPYDALLNLYEPGMTTATLDELFSSLKPELIKLLAAIKAKDRVCPPITKAANHEAQMQLGRDLLEKIGLKAAFSRLDLTSHPFCSTLGPYDIRLTTRIIKEDFLSNISSTLHEGGHGLYSHGLSQFTVGLPESQSASLGLDESQSRLYETRLGKSLPFVEAILPLIKQHLHLPHLTLNTLYETINEVKPHLIRIESDEISYCLHIILRYEIEKALIEGSLEVEQIPHVWHEKMTRFLGIAPKNDSEGCLQDIHWAMGSIGYFPTYALGNIYAASLYDAFSKKHPNFPQEVQNFNLTALQGFMQKNLYDHGRLLKPLEILKKATGYGLNPQVYLNYLKDKYSKLYNL